MYSEQPSQDSDHRTPMFTHRAGLSMALLQRRRCAVVITQGNDPGTITRMGDSDPRWYRVVIKRGEATLLDHLAGSFTRPGVVLGSHCACCNVETQYAMEYGLVGSTYSTTSLRVPRCYECRTHLPTSMPNANLQLLVLVAIAGGIFAAFAISLLYAIPTLLVMVAIAVMEVRNRARRRAMQTHGHFIGLRIAPSPNMLSFRTTNPQFANEIAKLNTQPSGHRSAR